MIYFMQINVENCNLLSKIKKLLNTLKYHIKNAKEGGPNGRHKL